jgi:four helix bundle protein
MRIDKFENCIAWQKAGALCVQTYKSFQNNKDWGFKDQIQRASVSIMNNIAEGFGKRNNKELRRYLLISLGSCTEVKSMLYLAVKLDYLTECKFQNLLKLAEEVSKTTSGLLKSL